MSEGLLTGWCVYCCWLRWECTAVNSLSTKRFTVRSPFSLERPTKFKMTKDVHSLPCYILSVWHVLPAEHFDRYYNVGVPLQYLMSALGTLIRMLSLTDCTWPEEIASTLCTAPTSTHYIIQLLHLLCSTGSLVLVFPCLSPNMFWARLQLLV